MDEKFDLNEKELEKVIGGLGMTNPVSNISKEEAEMIALQLGPGKDMGSWKTMSGEQFLKWWESSNNSAPGHSYPGGICGDNSNGSIENPDHSGAVSD